MGVNVENYTMEPMDVTVGNATRDLVKCLPDNAGDLHDKLFHIETISQGGQVSKHHVIIEVDSAVLTNDSVSGSSSIVASIASGDSAAVIAGVIATAIQAVADVNAKAKLDSVRIENTYMGATAKATDDATNGTGFTFTNEKMGSKTEIGATEGDISFGVEVDSAELKAHQFGSEVLGGIIRAINITDISLPVMETSVEKLKELMAGVSTLYTPGAGQEVIGLGSLAGSKQFTSQLKNSVRAVFHPTSLDESDTSKDVCIWAGFLNLDEILHSGENPKKVTVSLKTFIDHTKANAVNKAVIGEWDQDFLK